MITHLSQKVNWTVCLKFLVDLIKWMTFSQFVEMGILKAMCHKTKAEATREGPGSFPENNRSGCWELCPFHHRLQGLEGRACCIQHKTNCLVSTSLGFL